MQSSYSTVFNLLIAYSDRNARVSEANKNNSNKTFVREATQEDIDRF
ncbi:hypothetical protein HMPREF1247_0014 [Atopobium sp. BV3Ac4]|nr:hypothetical protein HMPREF1247_0014 [Atopobium sp. BV3Ac4]